jgi:hypothetical protein
MRTARQSLEGRTGERDEKKEAKKETRSLILTPAKIVKPRTRTSQGKPQSVEILVSPSRVKQEKRSPKNLQRWTVSSRLPQNVNARARCHYGGGASAFPKHTQKKTQRKITARKREGRLTVRSCALDGAPSLIYLTALRETLKR